MKFLDKIALNRLISIIADFILSIVKLLKPTQPHDTIDIVPKPKRKRPLKDLIDRVIK